MKKILKQIVSKQIVLVIPFLFVFFPAVTLAEDSGLVTCLIGDKCNFCDLVALVDRVIDYLIAICAAIFLLMLVFGGFKILSSAGDIAAVKKGKSVITTALIGIVIMLCGWLIIDTLMKTLISGGQISVTSINWGPWNEVKSDMCWKQRTLNDGKKTEFAKEEWAETSMDEVDALVVVGGVTMPAGDVAAALDGMSDDDARALLEAAGIEWKSSTGFEGVKPHVINELAKLDEACNCNILVTSVTDGSHAGGDFSHSAGFKADLRTYDNPELVNYVESLPSAGSWSDGTKLYYDSNSCGTYAVEGDHIDVVYKTGC